MTQVCRRIHYECEKIPYDFIHFINKTRFAEGFLLNTFSNARKSDQISVKYSICDEICPLLSRATQINLEQNGVSIRKMSEVFSLPFNLNETHEGVNTDVSITQWNLFGTSWRHTYRN